MTPRPHAFWLEDHAAGPVFAVFHAADPKAAAAAPVLIVPPWGWHDVASYRARRTWAEHLAALGHATLRIDLPGTGDSAGDAGSPDLVDGWIRTIERAAAWLASAAGAPAVTAIGLGLGGLLAEAASAGDAPIDALVAWAMPGDGREEVRRQRAFARLQPARFSLTEPEPQVLPAGWLEVNGFVLAAATIEALSTLPRTAPTAAPSRIRRALLLDADGIAAPASVPERLRAAGAEVATAAGPGWEAMTFHPQQHEPPEAVFDTVDAWLAAAPSPLTAGDVPPATASTPVSVDIGGVREMPVTVDAGGGELFGILTSVPRPGPAPLAAVFLNAGAVRRIGPNRIFTETARRWARMGVPTLRIDLDGIGDSDGDAGRYRDVGEFYARDMLATEIRRWCDEALARTGAQRLVLAGLCAGGHWAFQGADRDDRVTAAYLLNPGALEWRTNLVRERDAARLRRLADPRWWGRLVRGRVRRERIRAVASATVGEAVARLARRGRTSGVSSGGSSGVRQPVVAAADRSPDAVFARLAARDVRVVLAFSDDEPLEDELRRDGVLDRLPAWSNVSRERLPGRDHTLRPIVAQRAVHELLDRSLAADLAAVDARPDSGAA